MIDRTEVTDAPPGPQVTADTTVAARESYLPEPKRSGAALCMSGGGSRAALFHMGVLCRLNETGLLSQIDTITSVSGGSIVAAHLAAMVRDWPAHGEAIPDFDAKVVQPLESFVRRNMRTAPVARRLLFPWNWPNEEAAVEALASLFETYLNGNRLIDLPTAGPRYVFCASDNAFAVNWVFERDRMGDYQVGYARPENWTVGRAVAASACFPPVFNPMSVRLQPHDFRNGQYPSGPRRDALIAGLCLSDGGLYDNLALEPVWKDHEFVIVSDGGALFRPSADEGLRKRLKRYTTVMGRQGTTVRKRWLISSYMRGVLKGVYVGIGTPVARYEIDTPGYEEESVEEYIAPIRTDLDRFSDAEIGALANHGYFVMEAAIRRHLSTTTLPIRDAELRPPHPEWLDDIKVRDALKASSKTKLPFGRGSWWRYMGPRWMWPR